MAMSPIDKRRELTGIEANRVVDLIRPCFDKYVSRYDERKYPLDVYKELLRSFGAPETVTKGNIRTAILWKFGHLAKPLIPSRHEALISHLQESWPALLSCIIGSPSEVFHRLAGSVGGPSRFITVSFLLHLLRPTEVPIIDQHNFRAMNYYFRAVRSEWQSQSRPSRYDDMETLSGFINTTLFQWKTMNPATVPSQQSLDRFLMMFGKALKPRKFRLSRIGVAKTSLSFENKNPVAHGAIKLPFGGGGVTFDIHALIDHLKSLGSQCIVQGQTQCKFNAHRKPASLDFWLRKNFAKNADTKQAVNKVIQQIVATGLFEEGQVLCPDTGRRCKGIRMIPG